MDVTLRIPDSLAQRLEQRFGKPYHVFDFERFAISLLSKAAEEAMASQAPSPSGVGSPRTMPLPDSPFESEAIPAPCSLPDSPGGVRVRAHVLGSAPLPDPID